MKNQVKNQSSEVSIEKYFPEYAPIDSSVINPVEKVGVSPQLNSGIIFG